MPAALYRSSHREVYLIDLVARALIVLEQRFSNEIKGVLRELSLIITYLNLSTYPTLLTIIHYLFH